METRWNGSSNAYEQHVWDLKYIDAPILRYRDANGHTSSTSTGDGTSEEVLYFTFDANFNITGLVQENQTFVERYVYTPYGDRLVLTGTFGSRASTNYDQQLGHQGLYTDVESGTLYNRGRQGYHPGLGNFTQRDPRLTDYQDGMNLYQPYRGNPVIGRDPSGLHYLITQGFHCSIEVEVDSNGDGNLDGVLFAERIPGGIGVRWTPGATLVAGATQQNIAGGNRAMLAIQAAINVPGAVAKIITKGNATGRYYGGIYDATSTYLTFGRNCHHFCRDIANAYLDQAWWSPFFGRMSRK